MLQNYGTKYPVPIDTKYVIGEEQFYTTLFVPLSRCSVPMLLPIIV